MKKEDIKAFLGGAELSGFFVKSNSFEAIDNKVENFEEIIGNTKKSESKNTESLNDLVEKSIVDELIHNL